MIVHLSLNAHYEIKFSVYQCAQFSHVPKASNEESIKQIFWYIQGAKGNGITFQTNTRLELELYIDAEIEGLRNYEDS